MPKYTPAFTFRSTWMHQQLGNNVLQYRKLTPITLSTKCTGNWYLLKRCKFLKPLITKFPKLLINNSTKGNKFSSKFCFPILYFWDPVLFFFGGGSIRGNPLLHFGSQFLSLSLTIHIFPLLCLNINLYPENYL